MSLAQEVFVEPVLRVVNPSPAPALPKIVALTHEFYPSRGGIAVYTGEVAAAATRMGHPVEVWAPRNASLNTLDVPYAVEQMPLRGTQGWPCRLQLARHMHRNRALWQDSVLWLPEPGPLRAWLYLQLLDMGPVRGLVVTLHGSEINSISSTWYRRHLFRRLLNSADRIGVVSHYGRDQILHRFPELESRVVITHGALRSDVRGLDRPVDGRFKNGKIVVLTVGRIHPRKGQLAVVEALARLSPEERARYAYRTAGPVRRPSYLTQIQAAARNAGVDYQHLGEIDDAALDALYNRADIFAMTSEPNRHSVEGFGLSYLEASAHGLPIVAHRTGGVSDAVREGVTGLKVDPGDRQGLADTFRKLANSQELRRTLGENGRQWAHSFSWDHSARTLFDGIGGEG